MSQSPPATDQISSPAIEIQNILRGLLDRLFYVVISIGLLSFAANLMRALQHGWQASYAADIAAFVLLAVLLCFRRLFNPSLLFWLLLCIVFYNGLTSLISMGLASVGMLMLSVVSILAGIFFGLRTGMLVTGVCIAATGGVAWLSVSGRLPPVENLETFITSASSWVTQILTFAAYVIAVIFAAHSLHSRFRGVISEGRANSLNLQSALRRLARSERRYRLLAQNMSDVVVIQDPELRTTYVSPSVEKLFGYTPEEAKNLPLEKILTPESSKRALEEYTRFMALPDKPNARIPLMEYEYVRKDGSTFWGELQETFLFDPAGTLIGSQGVLRDITQHRETHKREELLAEELRHSEKMRVIGQLAGGVAHDFNNQLAGIMGFAQLLKLEYADEPAVRDYSTHMIAGVKRAADLTDKLLAFARKGKYQNIFMDVHQIITEVTDILRRSVDKTISIRCDCRAEHHRISGDPGQIQNMLLNIGLNARDAMPRGGDLKYETASLHCTGDLHPGYGDPLPAGDYVKISVADTGTGMTPEVAARMFEPFFTTKDPGSGTGMGLAAVYGTVHSHGGGIDCATTPDKGTVFTLYLPTVAATEIPVDQPVANDSGQLAEGGGTMLVVEDEPLVGHMTEALLGKMGYTVRLATTGQQALEMFEKDHEAIDLVLLDLMLPGIAGTEVFERVRKLRPEMPIVICSGYSSHTFAADLLNREHTGYIQKPFSIKKLSAVLSVLLPARDSGPHA